MKIRVFRSGKGDALMLSSDAGRHILVDGGVPDSYKEHFANTVGRLRDKGECIDLVCVSHIDRDHIGGVLEMMHNEVAWRVYEARKADPALRRGAGNPKPRIRRPAEVKAIWHNAFWEKVRTRRLNRRDTGEAFDVPDLMQRQSMLLAGGGEKLLAKGGDGVGVSAQSLASRMRFLGQSVGDAIELSRRVGARQLRIPVNPEFDGKFVVRKRGQNPVQLGDFELTVLGPTTTELNLLMKVWNDWLGKKESYLRQLLRKHDRDAGHLANADLPGVVAAAQKAAIEFASNQDVTPPNLASIIMLAENGDRSILLTGDADDESILRGLKEAGRLDPAGQIVVDVFKVPHHGAHNSYSDILARTVLARDYLFCGNGKHSNPERDVIEGYLRVLLEGADGHPPAERSGIKPTFWFTSGPGVENSSKLEAHWEMLRSVLDQWQDRFPRGFRYKFMRRGDSFLIR